MFKQLRARLVIVITSAIISRLIGWDFEENFGLRCHFWGDGGLMGKKVGDVFTYSDGRQ
jgi:hypothetical protein